MHDEAVRVSNIQDVTDSFKRSRENRRVSRKQSDKSLNIVVFKDTLGSSYDAHNTERLTRFDGVRRTRAIVQRMGNT